MKKRTKSSAWRRDRLHAGAELVYGGETGDACVGDSRQPGENLAGDVEEGWAKRNNKKWGTEMALQQLGGIKPQSKYCEDDKQERHVKRKDKHRKSPAKTRVKRDFKRKTPRARQDTFAD